MTAPSRPKHPFDRARLFILQTLLGVLALGPGVLRSVAYVSGGVIVVVGIAQTQEWAGWGELADLFGASRYAAHSLCLSSDLIIIRLFVASDASIGCAYYLIAYVLWRVHSNRDHIIRAVVIVMRDPIFIKLFAIFILGCGTTHWTEVLTLYTGVYRLDVLARLVTAGVSVVTALRLIHIAVASTGSDLLGDAGGEGIANYASKPLDLRNPAAKAMRTDVRDHIGGGTNRGERA